jgi:type I restriction enzyme R subunit
MNPDLRGRKLAEEFEPYFRDARLAEIIDPNLIHAIANKLDHSGIYDQTEVEAVAKALVEERGNNKLSASLAQAKDRFWKKFEAAERAHDQLELGRLEDSRKSLGSFVKTYDFLSQLYNYGDTDLEKKSIFCRLLARHVKPTNRNETIDLSGVELTEL